jgi:uncharacterized protein YcnI
MRATSLAPALALAGILASGIAEAHVVLGTKSAAAGSDFRAVFTVEHGCGNEPTTAIRIRLDDRIVSAKAVDKPGWKTGASSAGDSSPAVPREVSWTGGSLPTHTSATFVIDVRLPAAQPGTVIYFPLVQECGRASVRWIETPLPGERPDSMEYPAPFVTLTNASSSPGATR